MRFVMKSKFLPSYLALILFSIGCSQREKALPPADPSYFSVKSIQVTSQEITQKQSAFRFPSQKKYIIQISLQDRFQFKPIPNHPFILQDQDMQEHELLTDASGNIHHEVLVDFNYLDQEKYFSYEWILKAKSQFEGKFDIPFSINPWDTAKGGLVDLKDQSLPKHTPAQQAARIILDEISLQNTLGSQSVVRLQPQLQRYGLDGLPIQESIASANLQLNLRAQQSERPLFEERLNLEWNESFAQAVVEWKLPHHFNSQLPVSFEYELNAIETNLDPLKGSFTVASLLQNSKPALVSRQTAVESPEISSTPLQTPSSTVSFMSTNWSITRGEVLSRDSLGFPKSVEVLFQTCLKQKETQKSLQPGTEKFSVQAGPFKKKSLTLEKDSCLRWREVYTFKNFYSTGHWYSWTVSIQGEDLPYTGTVDTTSIRFNPWKDSQSSGALFTQNPPTPEETTSSSPSQARFSFNHYSVQFLGDGEYQLDKSLNATFSKKFLIRLAPVLQAPTLTQNQPHQKWPLTQGKLQVQVRVFNSKQELHQSVQEIEIKDGYLDIPLSLSLPFQRLAFLPLRNQIEISVSSKDVPIQSTTMRGDFLAQSHQGKLGLQSTASPQSSVVPLKPDTLSTTVPQPTQNSATDSTLSTIESFQKAFDLETRQSTSGKALWAQRESILQPILDQWKPREVQHYNYGDQLLKNEEDLMTFGRDLCFFYYYDSGLNPQEHLRLSLQYGQGVSSILSTLTWLRPRLQSYAHSADARLYFKNLFGGGRSPLIELKNEVLFFDSLFRKNPFSAQLLRSAEASLQVLDRALDRIEKTSSDLSQRQSRQLKKKVLDFHQAWIEIQNTLKTLNPRRWLNQKETTACFFDPPRWILLNVTEHVTEVTTPPKAIAYFPHRSIETQSEFMIEESKASKSGDASRNGEESKVIAGAGTHLNFDLKYFVGAGGTTYKKFENTSIHSSYRFSESETASEVKNRYRVRENTRLPYEQVTLEFGAHYQRCLVAGPRQESKKNTQAFHLCGDPTYHSPSLKQNWYFVRLGNISPPSSVGVLGDPHSVSNASLIKPIRGKLRFRLFQQKIQDALVNTPLDLFRHDFDIGRFNSLGNTAFDLHLQQAIIEGVFPGKLERVSE